MNPENDTRNVEDKYKGWPLEDIVSDLDSYGSKLQIVIENIDRDYNMGTIVRSANAFGVRHIHVIGRRQWNKRGAMMTDKYLHVHYYKTVDEFISVNGGNQVKIYAIDNLERAHAIEQTSIKEAAMMVFGSEGEGISAELRAACDETLAITQRGSTRSLNVGVAAGIAMYEYSRQHPVTKLS